MQLLSLILENVKQAKDFLVKKGIDPKQSKEYEQIRAMLSGNDGYTFWFVKQHFGNGTPLNELGEIWSIVQQERTTISNFSKPFAKLETVEEFWDEYYAQKNVSKARSAYNKFQKAQRSLLDFKNEGDRKLLDGLAEREDADENFYNKSSRYHTRKSLIDAITLFLSAKSDSGFSNLLKSLREDNQDIRYYSAKNNIIIICVDYPSIRKWGGDTSWCIVGSEYTFRNYNSAELSQQFIIFLTDESGNKSKIGVTTNISGYRAAHFKNDEHCSEKSLESILSERGVNYGILFPSKDVLSKIENWDKFRASVLKAMGFSSVQILSKKSISSIIDDDLPIFSKKELIDNKILDGRWRKLLISILIKCGFTNQEIIENKPLDSIFDNELDLLTKSQLVQNKIIDGRWDRLPVGYLLKIGFNKQEIIKNKEVFNSASTRGDLSYFTKEEIDKYKLLEKTELYTSDLKSFSIEDIMKRGLWKRLKIQYVSELEEFGFDYPSLKKICLGLINDQLKSDFVAKYIAANTNRETALKNMKKSHWLSYTDENKMRHSAETDETNHYKLILIRLLKPTEEEVSNSYLFSIIKPESRDGIVGRISSILSELEKLGRSVSDKEFLEILGEQIRGNDGWVLSLSKLIKSGIRRQFCIDIITKKLKSLEGQKFIGLSSSGDFYIFQLKRQDLIEIMENLGGGELYQSIFNISKLIMSYNPNYLKVSDRDYHSVDVVTTLSNIDFFSIKLDIEEFFNLFSSAGISNLPKLIKYLKDRGYEFTDDDLTKGAEKIKNYNDGETELWILLIRCGVSPKDNYDKLIDWVESKTSPLTKHVKDKLEEVFKNKEEYYKRWKELHSMDKINEAISSILEVTEYWGSGGGRGNLKLDEWFEKYYDIVSAVNWDREIKKRRDYECKYFNGYVQILTKLGKKKELMDTKCPSELFGAANYSNEGIKKLCQIIADKYIVNGDRAYRKMKLNDEERELLYEWLNKQVDLGTKNSPDDPLQRGWGHIYSIMAIVWYLYDKDKFWRYIDAVIQLKGNVHRIDWVDSKQIIKKSSTVRLKELSKLLPFLAEEGYWEDFEKILKMFSESKITKTEYKDSMYYLSYNSFFNVRTEEDRKAGEFRTKDNKLSNSVRSKYTELLNKYIKEPESKSKKIKESRILLWNDFKK